MAARSRRGFDDYNRVLEHRHFDEQPSLELATGAALRHREEGDEKIVELLDVDGWKEIKRWEA